MLRSLCIALEVPHGGGQFVKTKPHEVASLEPALFRVMHGRHRRKVLPVAKCLGDTFYLNFKPRCRSSRKLECCPPLLDRRCARRLLPQQLWSMWVTKSVASVRYNLDVGVLRDWLGHLLVSLYMMNR
jgi:hypothetical protein